eukprot:COSAG05_NODE_2512_length_2960_cov_10.036001_3_plen_103_part_00
MLIPTMPLLCWQHYANFYPTCCHSILRFAVDSPVALLAAQWTHVRTMGHQVDQILWHAPDAKMVKGSEKTTVRGVLRQIYGPRTIFGPSTFGSLTGVHAHFQ